VATAWWGKRTAPRPGSSPSLKPDAVLLDVRLPDGSGLDLCEVLTREAEAPAVLLVASYGSMDASLARERGARAFVAKEDLARLDLHTVWERSGPI
jgi:DNA-binding response OmpR family regulator